MSARQTKQMATRRVDPQDEEAQHAALGYEPEFFDEKPVMSHAPYDPGRFNPAMLKGRALVVSRDALWYVQHNTYILIGLIGLVVLVVGLFLGTHVFGGRVFPNVWSLGVDVGDMTVDEAASALQTKWATRRSNSATATASGRHRPGSSACSSTPPRRSPTRAPPG